MKPPWHKLFPLLLIAAGFLAYHNSFSGVFILDDGGAIVNNERIHSLWPPWAILFDVRPFLNLTLALNYAIGGKNVWGYHAVNLVIHLGAGLVLFGIARRSLYFVIARSPEGDPSPVIASPPKGGQSNLWGSGQAPQSQGIASASLGTSPRNDVLAFTIALLWLVHPLQTQSVTYIIQRAESLMGLFYLWTLYGVIRGAESHRPLRWHLSAIVSFILGMETKEVMVTAPLITFLYDRIFLASSWKEVFRKRWGLYLGFLAVAGISLTSLIFSYAQWSDPTAGFALEEITPFEYAITQWGVILHYLGLVFWPHPLVLDYYWPVAESLREVLFPGFLIFLLLSATLFLLRYRPPLGFLGVWFFFILAPSSSIMPIADVAFEHRMYLPLASVITLAVIGGNYCFQKLIGTASLKRKVAVGFVSLLTLVLSVLTIQRNEVYGSEIRIWLDTARKRPQNPRPYNSIGLILASSNRLEEARAYFAKAVRLNPKDPGFHANLANVYRQLGKGDEAITHYQEAIRLKPDAFGPYNNMGNIFRDKGDFEQALHYYEEALKWSPHSAQIHDNIGIILMEQGTLEEAALRFREAIRLKPNFAQAHNNLGLALAKQGRVAEAIKYFKEAMRLDPNFPDPKKNLALIERSQNEAIAT